jgi:PAS domain S-box-containing protein
VQLAEIAGIVSREKNYSVRAPTNHNLGEIAILVEAFNEMLAQIQGRDAALQQAHERLNLALKSSGVGTWGQGIAENSIAWDDYMAPLFGLKSGMFSGKYEDFLNLVHPEDRERLLSTADDSIASNDSFDAEFRVIWPDGSIHVLSERGKVHRDQTGRPMRMIGVCWDISERKRAEEERKTLLKSEQEARRTAELLNRVGPMLLGELDLKKLTQKVIDLATQLSGAEFGAFARLVVNEDGTSYMLYTFSGAPCEAFAEMPRLADLAGLGPKFSEKIIIRSDDITQGVPVGQPPFPFGVPGCTLPVRSYLGVPVISRFGEVMGGLFFGHYRPAMFTERHEQLVLGIAAQAAIAIDNAHLFEQVRQGRLRAEETSMALRRVNSDLEQFTYLAYHDLREPLRMVKIYTQKLKKEYSAKLGPGADLCIRYTVQGATRMEQLVRDLLTYTHAVSECQEPAPPLSAEIPLASVISSLQQVLAESGGSISHERLPEVKMHRVHLEQLFNNLTANAIKYRGAKPPEIKIRAQRGQTEWVFSVQDNGIGIDRQYREQIFGVFKRLHSAEEYSGTGIGLAICRKIVQRYGGRIWVESELRKGATFLFTVPDGDAGAARE